MSNDSLECHVFVVVVVVCVLCAAPAKYAVWLMSSLKMAKRTNGWMDDAVSDCACNRDDERTRARLVSFNLLFRMRWESLGYLSAQLYTVRVRIKKYCFNRRSTTASSAHITTTTKNKWNNGKETPVKRLSFWFMNDIFSNALKLLLNIIESVYPLLVLSVQAKNIEKTWKRAKRKKIALSDIRWSWPVLFALPFIHS